MTPTATSAPATVRARRILDRAASLVNQPASAANVRPAAADPGVELLLGLVQTTRRPRPVVQHPLVQPLAEPEFLRVRIQRVMDDLVRPGDRLSTRMLHADDDISASRQRRVCTEQGERGYRRGSKNWPGVVGGASHRRGGRGSPRRGCGGRQGVPGLACVGCEADAVGPAHDEAGVRTAARPRPYFLVSGVTILVEVGPSSPFVIGLPVSGVSGLSGTTSSSRPSWIRRRGCPSPRSCPSHGSRPWSSCRSRSSLAVRALLLLPAVRGRRTRSARDRGLRLLPRVGSGRWIRHGGSVPPRRACRCQGWAVGRASELPWAASLGSACVGRRRLWGCRCAHELVDDRREP